MSNIKEALSTWDTADELLVEKIEKLEAELLTKIENVNSQMSLPSGMNLSEFADSLYTTFGGMRSYRVGLGNYTETGVFSNIFGFAEINIRHSNIMTIIVHAANTTSNHAYIYKRSKSDLGWGNWYKFTGTAV